MANKKFRIGIDLGGTKISAIVLSQEGQILRHIRQSSPQNNYINSLETLSDVILSLMSEFDGSATVGIGMPGSISPKTGFVQNANSTWLNGKPLDKDLMAKTACEIRFANDANCFALSESIDGAASEAKSVFGVIIGTGCGGGMIVDKKIINGPRGIGGEWGHNPLPWPKEDEIPGPKCWCGLNGCMETWVSGPGLSKDFYSLSGENLKVEEIDNLAKKGDANAKKCLERFTSRLSRGLASVVNLFDPEVIVLGGGLSNLQFLYDALEDGISPYVFCDHKYIDIRPPKYGDDSGVRGAAWLWND